MKIKVIRDFTQPVKNYPKIMESVKTGSIVLFDRHGEGTILQMGQGSDQIGCHSVSFKMDVFKDFAGTVIIEQGLRGESQ